MTLAPTKQSLNLTESKPSRDTLADNAAYKALWATHPHGKTGFYALARCMQAYARGEIERGEQMLEIAIEEHKSFKGSLFDEK